MNFFKSMLTEDGTQNISVGSFVVFLMVLCYLWAFLFVVVQTKVLPDIPYSYGGLIAAIYFAKKGTTSAINIWGKEKQQ